MADLYKPRSSKYFFKRGEPEVGLKFSRMEKRQQESRMKTRKSALSKMRSRGYK